MLNHLRPSAFICGSLLLLAVTAHAQTYPAKPVRFILSYPPGGATDTLGRIVAKELSDAWNVNVIADNRPGASGNIGTSLCAKSPPDGYTMCMVAPAQAIASRLSANASYDSLKDFSHVTLIATVPMLLLVHPALPVKNLAELIALAKRRPGALNYASSGGGASPHLAMELLKQQAGIDIALITYKGAGAQMVDHLAGRPQSVCLGVIQICELSGQEHVRRFSSSDHFSDRPEDSCVFGSKENFPSVRSDNQHTFIAHTFRHHGQESQSHLSAC